MNNDFKKLDVNNPNALKELSKNPLAWMASYKIGKSLCRKCFSIVARNAKLGDKAQRDLLCKYCQKKWDNVMGEYK